jgi:hypothetical protein
VYSGAENQQSMQLLRMGKQANSNTLARGLAGRLRHKIL